MSRSLVGLDRQGPTRVGPRRGVISLEVAWREWLVGSVSRLSCTTWTSPALSEDPLHTRVHRCWPIYRARNGHAQSFIEMIRPALSSGPVGGLASSAEQYTGPSFGGAYSLPSSSVF